MHRLAVAVGGAVGAMARHGVGMFATALGGAALPWSTLAVNVCGSWALGLFMWLLPATAITPAVRVGLTIGFCGGFTTFSTFAQETVMLARAGDLPFALGYVGASVLFGVAGTMGGMATGALLTRQRRSAPARRSALGAHHARATSSEAPSAHEAEDRR